jgi:hypothetical protein
LRRPPQSILLWPTEKPRAKQKILVNALAGLVVPTITVPITAAPTRPVGSDPMSPLSVIAWIVFACVFGSALIGMSLHRVLPEHYLASESKDVVKLGIALIGTMAALVLSLLLSSAKSSFDTRNQEFAQMAANMVLLDRLLAHYGAEAKPARETLRGALEDALAQI